MFADRYLAISRPLLYVPVRTPRLVFCWILAVNILSGIHPASRTKSSNFSLFLSTRLCSSFLRLVRQPSSGSDLQWICSGEVVIVIYLYMSICHSQCHRVTLLAFLFLYSWQGMFQSHLTQSLEKRILLMPEPEFSQNL